MMEEWCKDGWRVGDEKGRWAGYKKEGWREDGGMMEGWKEVKNENKSEGCKE